MSQKYFTTLTNIGAALHANAQLQQTTVPWTHLVLGDGNGVEPVPSPAQTGVIREVDRLAISSIEPDPDNPNWIVIEAVIPADRGGYVVRETALMGGANGNQCIAVGNYPSATKPLLSEGAGSELVIRVVVEIAHTATVTLKIDPAVVIASRDWVEKQHATQQKRGLVRLATLSEALLGEAGDIAVTPAGVMRLVSEISADSGAVVFSTPGVFTWDVPEILRSGKKKVRELIVAGAGGASGSVPATSATENGCSEAAAAGGVAIKTSFSLEGVESVTVTVGAGGTCVVGAAGTTGGASSFGTYAAATGGSGTPAGTKFSVFPRNIHPSLFSGVGQGGDINIYGGTGSQASFNLMNDFAGGTGGSGLFGGRGGARSVGAPADKPPSPGAGGGSAQLNNSAAARAGNPGADGLVSVTW